MRIANSTVKVMFGTNQACNFINDEMFKSNVFAFKKASIFITGMSNSLFFLTEIGAV